MQISLIHKLPAKIRFLTWQSLLLSKFNYGLTTIAQYDNKVVLIAKSFFYQSFRALMNIKSKPIAEGLLKIILGLPFNDFFELQKRLMRSRLDNAVMADKDKAMLHDTKHRIMKMVTNGLEPLIRFSTNCLLGTHSTKIELKCDCSARISDAHVNDCATAKERINRTLPQNNFVDITFR